MPSALLYLAIFVPLFSLAAGLLAAHLYYRRIRALVRSIRQRELGSEGGGLTIREVEEANAMELEVLQRIERDKRGATRATVRAVQEGINDTSPTKSRNTGLSFSRPPSSLSSSNKPSVVPPSRPSADRSYRLADLAQLEEGRDVGDGWGRYEPMSSSEREELSGTDTGEASASSGGTGQKASPFTRSSASLHCPFEYDPSPPFGSPPAPSGSTPFPTSSSSKQSGTRSRLSFFHSASEGTSSDTRGGGTTSDSRTTINSRGERVLRRRSRRSSRPPYAPDRSSPTGSAVCVIQVKSRSSEKIEPLPGAPPSPTRVKKRRGTFGVGEGEDTDNDADESDSLVQVDEAGQGGGQGERTGISRSARVRRSRRPADETIRAPLSSTAPPPPLAATSSSGLANPRFTSSPLSASPSSTPLAAPSPFFTTSIAGYRPAPLASTPLALGTEEKCAVVPSRLSPTVSPQPFPSHYSSADLHSMATFPPSSSSDEEQLHAVTPTPAKNKYDSVTLPSSFPPSPPASPPSQRSFAPATLSPPLNPPRFIPSPRPAPTLRPAPSPPAPSPALPPPPPQQHPLFPQHPLPPTQKRDNSSETTQTNLSRWTTLAQQGSATSTPFTGRSGHQDDLERDPDIAFARVVEEAHAKKPHVGGGSASQSQNPLNGSGIATPLHSRSASAPGSIFLEHFSDEGGALVEEPGCVDGDSEGRREEEERLLVPSFRRELAGEGGLPCMGQVRAGVDSKGSLVGGGNGGGGGTWGRSGGKGLKPTNPDPSLPSASSSLSPATLDAPAIPSPSVYSRASSFVGSGAAGREGEGEER